MFPEPSLNTSLNQRSISSLKQKGHWYLQAEQDPALSLLNISWWTSCHQYWDKHSPRYILRQKKGFYIVSYYSRKFEVTLSQIDSDTNCVVFFFFWSICTLLKHLLSIYKFEQEKSNYSIHPIHYKYRPGHIKIIIPLSEHSRPCLKTFFFFFREILKLLLCLTHTSFITSLRNLQTNLRMHVDVSKSNFR